MSLLTCVQHAHTTTCYLGYGGLVLWLWLNVALALIVGGVHSKR